MRSLRFSLPLLCLIATVEFVSAQPLVCPAGTGMSASNCQMFHFHVQAWKPDTKTFVELFGMGSYSSLEACGKAKAAEAGKNQAVIQFFRTRDEDARLEVNRFGDCHCDMTTDRSNPRFLDDATRRAQLRLREDINAEWRERLLDADQRSDAAIVRLLIVPPTTAFPGGGAKFVPLVETTAKPSGGTQELKVTRMAQSAGAAPPSFDLPLAEVDLSPGALASAPPRQQPVAAPRPTPPTPSNTSEPVTTVAVQPEPAPAVDMSSGEPVDVAVDESITSFFEHQLKIVSNILEAKEQIADEEIKNKIFEAASERAQLLTNLQKITEASQRSRLATRVKAARGEDRLALFRKLFGDSIQKHWAPADARDAIVDVRPEIANDPVSVLRDSTGSFSEADKKLALYLFLARNTTMTSMQETWISEMIESFLAS